MLVLFGLCWFFVLVLLLVLFVLMMVCGGGKVICLVLFLLMVNWLKIVLDNFEVVNLVLMWVISLVGMFYCYGGNILDLGFDCSGLVVYVYCEMLDL